MEYIYAELILKNLKTFEDVPPWFRDQVYLELKNRGEEEKATVDGKQYTL